MSYTVDWIAKVISVPTADLTLVSGTRYSLDMADFLAEVRRLEWEPTEGLWAPTILDHTNTRLDFAGVNYAPFDDLLNDYTVQFTGVATRVDLLGSNNDIIDVLIPTGVSVVPSNSAGLQIVQTGSGVTELDKTDISYCVLDDDLSTHNSPFSLSKTQQHLIYGRIVHIDIINGSPGTAWPVGSDDFPSNNWADAKTIADGHGIIEFHIHGTMVVGATDNISDYTFAGPHDIDAMLVLTAGCTTQNTRMRNLIIIGAFDGKVNVELCTMLAITNFKGFILECVFADNISVVDPATPTLIYNSGSGKVSPPIEIDLNNASLSIGGWKGNMKLVNKTGSGTNYVELMAGTVEIDSTCVAGTIVIAGVGSVVDNSGAGCTVVTNGLLDSAEVTDLWKLQGLKEGSPMTVTPTSRSVDGIDQEITGDGENLTIVERI